MKVIEYIEEALKDLIEARPYITTNSITVARSTDGTLKKSSPFVQIECETIERQSNNHNNYFIETSIQSVANVQEDLQANDIDALYSDMSDFTYYELTAATLQAAINAIDATSGIVIAGFDYMSSGMQVPEQFRYKENRLNIALVYTP